MHKYMRAIGFSHFDNKRKLQELLTEVVVNPDKRGITLNPENEMIGEFSKDFAPGLGITVCGEFENEEKFTYEYYYPYLEGTGFLPARMFLWNGMQKRIPMRVCVMISRWEFPLFSI